MHQPHPSIANQTRRHPILSQPILNVLLHWGSALSMRSSSSLGIIAASFTLLHLGFGAEQAQAYPRQASVAIDQQQGDSYTALVRRAENTARTTAQQMFDQDILVSEVAITVVGESGSSIVPILTMRVSRDNWRTRPDPQQWSTYFRSARSLLELGTPIGSPAPVPFDSGNPAATQPGVVSPANPASATASPETSPANQSTEQLPPGTPAPPPVPVQTTAPSPAP